MDNPQSVIGTSSYQQTSGRHQHQFINNGYDNSDLYEYDGNSNNAPGRINDFIINNNQNNSSNNNDNNTSTTNQSKQIVIPKIFYFFFFAAFGSLFPLMAIYFKQMAFSSFQVGTLFGLRPFVEFLSVPFWAKFANKHRHCKTILLFSILCWILFTIGVGFIQPPVHSCLMHNGTHIFFEKKINFQKKTEKRNIEYFDSINRKKKHTSIYDDEIKFDLKTTTKHQNYFMNKIRDKINHDLTNNIVTDAHKFQTTASNSLINQIVNKTIENIITSEILKTNSASHHAITSTTKSNKLFPMIDFNIIKHQNKKQNFFDSSSLDSKKLTGRIVYLNNSAFKFVKPQLKTSIVYEKEDVTHIFIVFLIFILVGEFFSAPAITLADQVTLQYLGTTNQSDLYNRQRMFGSLGWGIAMFSIGILLDQSHQFTDHPCGLAGPDERNYSVCFTVYSILMTCAFVAATQFKFDYDETNYGEEIPLKSVLKSTVNHIRGSKYQQFESKKFENEPDDSEQQQPEQIIHINTVVNLEETTLFKYKRLFEQCKSLKYFIFIFMIVFMGVGVGLVFTFLFWHLQDLGGTSTLYGIASIANHLSELVAYLFVSDIIAKYGHVKIFYAGLIGNSMRFLYVSLLTDPWWIIPFEFIQGITHALVFASANSYFAQSVSNDLSSTAQALLQALHFGLGRGLGSILGGLLISLYGARLTFFLYGLSCLLLFCLTMGYKHFNLDLKLNNNEQLQQQQQQQQQQELNLSEQNTITNVVNPLMQDTNYYYQSEQTENSNLKLFVSPHGAPSTNPNWTRQFK